VIPGFSRPKTFTHRARRLSSVFQVGAICCFIITGTNSCVVLPMSRPRNPSWATPMTVSGWLLTTMEVPMTAGSRANRFTQ
jgi:hypothetical protein